MKTDPIILIVDNEKPSRRLLRAVLEPHGYKVVEAANAELGLARAVECQPEVIILEIALPAGEGLRVLQSLREWSRVPVLVLSERADDEAKVAALDAGASDYLTKPFSTAELLARLRVLQRPLPNMPDGPLLMEGELVVNLATREIVLGGRKVKLTPKEHVLFHVLARYAGKVVTCSHLLRSIWGIHSGNQVHDLQVLVWQLRKKLGSSGGATLLRTEGRLGYSLALSAKHPLSPHAVNREGQGTVLPTTGRSF